MHTIRLRAAWRYDGVSHTRRFNKPTGLDGGERVWIAMDGAVEASLNDVPLKFGQAGRSDVTDLLRPSNTLSIGACDAALLDTVRLEIGSG